MVRYGIEAPNREHSAYIVYKLVDGKKTDLFSTRNADEAAACLADFLRLSK